MTTDKKARMLIFTGDGKGKTTAALGMALRAAGHGLRSMIIQFVKKDEATGEIAAIGKIQEIDILQSGLGFIPARESADFDTHRKRAEAGLKKAESILSTGDYDIVVLDEICVTVSKGLLEEKDVLRAIGAARPDSVVVLTGRNAGKRLIEAADTVTEMQCLKHGYNEGIDAQMGVEW